MLTNFGCCVCIEYGKRNLRLESGRAGTDDNIRDDIRTTG